METEPKLCINCKKLDPEMRCTKYVIQTDLVTGRKLYPLAKWRREDGGECGYDAKDFEGNLTHTTA